MTSRDGNNGMELAWTHADFEAALSGGHDAPGGLVSLVLAVRSMTEPLVPDSLAQAHIAAAAGAAAAVASTSTSPTFAAPTRRRRARRRLTLAGLVSGFWAKLALGAVAVAAVGGTAGATGNLPDPLQDAFTEATRWLGVEIAQVDDTLPDGTLVPDAAGDEDPSTPATTGPQDPTTLPPGGGNSDSAREHAVAVAAWNRCRMMLHHEAEGQPTAEDVLAACGDQPTPPRPDGTGPPDDRGRPDDPGQPENPGKPEDPGQPGDPGKPDDKGNPDNPGKPEDPGQPGDPGKPEDPGQPGDPGKPDDPGQPGDPGKSGDDVDPDEDDDSDQDEDES